MGFNSAFKGLNDTASQSLSITGATQIQKLKSNWKFVAFFYFCGIFSMPGIITVKPSLTVLQFHAEVSFTLVVKLMLPYVIF